MNHHDVRYGKDVHIAINALKCDRVSTVSCERKRKYEISTPFEIHLSDSTKKDTLDTKEYWFSCAQVGCVLKTKRER